ncbi:MAG: WD40 repeat domain-containing protein [Chamaesiphon sp. CSU_1_12]|nr:WD40 repeat domain-containing protein [Chamaesiphon sp. CSU_1_12]
MLFFENLALYPATVPTYIREIQQRLILAPLVNAVGSDRVAEFANIYLRKKRYSAYGVSNLINLLLYCQLDLNQYDWRARQIRAVDFQNLHLQNIDFSGVTFDRCRFSQGMGTLLGIVFSPDGQLIAAGDTNFQIKIWSVADNEEIALLTGHRGWVWDIQFSPDSQYLVSGSSDRQLRIWHARSGQCLQTIEAHTDWVWRVGFWLNSQLIVSLGADRQISIWWWQTRTKFLSVTIPDSGLRDGVFHGGRGLLATCAYDAINLWHLWTLRKIRTLQMSPTIRIKKATFSHDGRILIGLSTNCVVYGWDVDSGELCLTLTGHPTQVNEIQTLETGEIITTCLEQLRVWNGDTGQCLQVINFAGNGTICVAYHFDRSRSVPFGESRRLLATGSDNGAISIWNLTTGKRTNSTSGNAPRTLALAANLSNAIVATGQDDGLLHLWNFNRLEPHSYHLRSPFPPIWAPSRCWLLVPMVN